MANNQTCGDGYKFRNVWCGLNSSSEITILADDKCESAVPLSRVPCSIPCQTDCTYSSWSRWSPCSKSCLDPSKDGDSPVQTRSRILLNKEDFLVCPNTERYRSCFPPLCSLLLETADLPSNSDCVYSNWNSWSRCSTSCGQNDLQESIRSRTRSVLGQGSNTTCVTQTQNLKSCPAPSCNTFSWSTGEWSQCKRIHRDPLVDDPDGICYKGMKTRAARCLSSRGETTYECPKNTKPVDRVNRQKSPILCVGGSIWFYAQRIGHVRKPPQEPKNPEFSKNFSKKNFGKSIFSVHLRTPYRVFKCAHLDARQGKTVKIYKSTHCWSKIDFGYFSELWSKIWGGFRTCPIRWA